MRENKLSSEAREITYSVRRHFIGLAIAALMAWKLKVISATTKTQMVSGVRKA